jgi:hypothetical protein
MMMMVYSAVRSLPPAGGRWTFLLLHGWSLEALLFVVVVGLVWQAGMMKDQPTLPLFRCSACQADARSPSISVSMTASAFFVVDPQEVDLAYCDTFCFQFALREEACSPASDSSPRPSLHCRQFIFIYLYRYDKHPKNGTKRCWLFKRVLDQDSRVPTMHCMYGYISRKSPQGGSAHSY